MDTQKVNELIELGGLSSLGAEIGHQVDFDGPYELHIGQCVAYQSGPWRRASFCYESSGKFLEETSQDAFIEIHVPVG